MKRFIDLRGQIYADDDLPEHLREPCFAFYCTVVDRFETFCGAQTFTSLADFQEAYFHEKGALDDPYGRLFNLMPEWAKSSAQR